MRYEIELSLNSKKRVKVSAETPADALRSAENLNPGFVAKTATELLDGDKDGETYELVAWCEGCSRAIVGREVHFITEDGITLCANCAPPSE